MSCCRSPVQATQPCGAGTSLLAPAPHSLLPLVQPLSVSPSTHLALEEADPALPPFQHGHQRLPHAAPSRRRLGEAAAGCQPKGWGAGWGGLLTTGPCLLLAQSLLPAGSSLLQPPSLAVGSAKAALPTAGSEDFSLLKSAPSPALLSPSGQLLSSGIQVGEGWGGNGFHL